MFQQRTFVSPYLAESLLHSWNSLLLFLPTAKEFLLALHKSQLSHFRAVLPFSFFSQISRSLAGKNRSFFPGSLFFLSPPQSRWKKSEEGTAEATYGRNGKLYRRLSFSLNFSLSRRVSTAKMVLAAFFYEDFWLFFGGGSLRRLNWMEAGKGMQKTA